MWGTLSRVLRMGGKQATDSTLIAPYVYAFWPDSLNAFENIAAITGGNVRVYEQPTTSSAVIGTTSHAVLELEQKQDAWARVALPNNRNGSVRDEDVYSPVDWRAFFVRRNGKWLLQTFVAGD